MPTAGITRINFDAKLRRNSTDPQDIFIAHIAAMDTYARALMIAERILRESDYCSLRKQRYASFDQGNGKAFEDGGLSLEDLKRIAFMEGEPQMRSGRQELLEQMLSRYI
jgi:xylose isomerase